MSTSTQRRHFLKSLLSAGIAGSLGSLGQLALMREGIAASPDFSGYKALVCIFLYGGNDSYNMLIPTGSETNKSYTDYQTIRGNLAVSSNDLGLSSIAGGNTDLNNGKLGRGSENPYYTDGNQDSAYIKGLYNLASTKSINLGVNGVMPELAQLITDNKASVIGNVGNLVHPLSHSDALNNINLPLFLFAHNHQQRALQTGQGNNLNDTGWAGRIADQWQGINNSSPLGLNISYFGNDRMLIGDQTTPLVINPGNPPSYSQMSNTTSNSNMDRRALFKALTGSTNSSNNLTFDASNTVKNTDPFKQLYGGMLGKSMQTFDLLYDAWNNNDVSYSRTDSYGDSLFNIPTSSDLGFGNNISGSLIKQLEAVAKMIDLGAKDAFNSGNYKRQIFTVRLGGFDTHAAQESKHPLLLRELSMALWKFQNAMEELGHNNNVTTFTMSDFGRTMSNNGDGTDHAWGAQHIVMGGDGNNNSGNLKGGQFIGSIPDITLGGGADYGSKGRLIPTLAQDQLNATLCNWFGVDENIMSLIFPNLENFKSGSALSTAYLNNLFAS